MNDFVVLLFLGFSLFFTTLGVMGALAMSTPLQKLNFSACLSAAATPFLVVAALTLAHDASSRFKLLAILVLVLFGNAALSHATARAVWNREKRLQKSGPPDAGESHL